MRLGITRLIRHALLMLFLVSGTLFPAWASQEVPGYTQEACMECHASESGESSLQISLESYKASVHGRSLTCLGCHTGITGEAHMENEGETTVDCIQCHGTKGGPRGLVARLSTFRIASHGKGDLAGDYEMDNCLGCHQGTGAHGETEPVTADNCQVCHDTRLPSAMWGKIHPDQRNRSPLAAGMYICFALFFLIAVMRYANPMFDRLLERINRHGRTGIGSPGSARNED